MISWNDVNKLQNQKTELQLKLNDLLSSKSASEDDINELKSEILHLDKNIKRILGTNEVERQRELKRNKSGLDERSKKAYYALKKRYDMISKLNEATNNFIVAIDRSYKKDQEYVKVKA